MQKFRRIDRVALFGILLIAVPGCAARPLAHSFSDLHYRLRPGNTVFVTDDRGLETKARIMEISESDLLLDASGVTRRLDRHQVRQLDLDPDSRWIGFYTGFGIGATNLLFSDPRTEPCPDNPQRQCQDYDWGGRILLTGLLSIAGAGMDALFHKRYPVYVAPDKPDRSSMHFFVAPDNETAQFGFSARFH